MRRELRRISGSSIFSTCFLRALAWRAFVAFAREAVDELLHLLDAPLGAGDLGVLLGDRELLGALEGVVVAAVEPQLGVVEVGDRVADGVEEVAVVRDDDERPRELPQVALEPLDRGDVEVVRGLVEQQQVGLCEERLGEQHAQPEAARELAHRSIVARVLDAEAAEQGGGLRLRLVALQPGDRDFEVGEALTGLRG